MEAGLLRPTHLQDLARALDEGIASIIAAGHDPNPSADEIAPANLPTGSDSTPIGSSFTNQPRTGFLSNSPTAPESAPVPSTSNLASGTLDRASSSRITGRLPMEVSRLSNRLTGLEQSINNLTTSFQSNQKLLVPALIQFTRAANDQQTFTRAILTEQGLRQQWQRSVDDVLDDIQEDRQRTADNLDAILRNQGRANAILHHWDTVVLASM